MAIAIDASTPSIVSGNGTNTVTTASFTPPSGSFLVALWARSDIGIPAITNSGTGFTWTQRVTTSIEGIAGDMAIWTAPVTVSQSMTVTATLPFSETDRHAMKVYVLTGADTTGIGNVGTGASGTNNVTIALYSSSVNDSRGFAIANDLTGSGGVTTTDTSGGTWNFSTISSGIATSKAAATPTSGTVVNFNFNASGSGSVEWICCAIEIKPSTSGLTITNTGIATAEAFGTAQLNRTAPITGITSAEAFGTAALVIDQFINCTGIASAEAFGTSKLSMQILASGIPSVEAFGTPLVLSAVVPTGIPSEEAFGTTSVIVEQFILGTGIPSAEGFGVPSLIAEQLIFPTGIGSLEAFGTPDMDAGGDEVISPTGIPTGQAFGLPTIGNSQLWVLVNSSIQETPAVRDVLLIRYGLDRGISIIKRHNGTYYQARFPAQTELEEAEDFWLGGYRHYLTDEEAFDLIDNGFGPLMHLEPFPDYGGYA